MEDSTQIPIPFSSEFTCPDSTGQPAQQNLQTSFGHDTCLVNDELCQQLKSTSPSNSFFFPINAKVASPVNNQTLTDSGDWHDLNHEQSENGGQDDTGKTKKTRRRKPVNCSFCRRRKLKCDRKHPCSNCVKRNIETSCTYATEPNNGGPKEEPLATATSVKHDKPPCILPESSTARSLTNSSRQQSCSSISDLSSVGHTSMNHNEVTSAASSPGGRAIKIKPQQPRLVSRKARISRQTTNKPKFSDFSEQEPNPDQAVALKKQLDKMEMLVLSMLQEKNSSDETYSSNSSPDTIDENSAMMEWSQAGDTGIRSATKKARESLGMLKVDMNGKSIYRGDTHWGSLFGEIQQLDDMLTRLKLTNPVPKCTDTDKQVTSPLLFMACGPSKMSPLDVLDTIPSRAICDLLIDRFFEVCDPCFPVVHAGAFRQECDDFWVNPTGTELVWVSLFLGVISFALQSYLPENVPPVFRGDPKKTWTLWLEGSEVCAFRGKLTYKPSLNNIRSMIIWILAQADVIAKPDWVDTASISIATVIRMCQAMGLHRDPKWFSIPRYEAEERRRIWYTVVYMESFCSLTQGLPAFIHSSGCDVSLPANIDEFDNIQERGQMTQPIPLSIPTSSSYLVHRSRMTKWLVKILEVSSALGSSADTQDYNQVLETHDSIHKAFCEAPVSLTTSVLNPTHEPVPPAQQIQQFWYELDYLRSILVLHRHFATLGMENIKYLRSRSETLRATSRILKLHNWFSKSPEAQGVRDNCSWFVWHFGVSHFLHAAMLACLALINHNGSFAPDEKIELTDLVDGTLRTFHQDKETCGKLTLLLKAMLMRIYEVSAMSDEQIAELRRSRAPPHGRKVSLNIPVFSRSITIESSTKLGDDKSNNNSCDKSYKRSRSESDGGLVNGSNIGSNINNNNENLMSDEMTGVTMEPTAAISAPDPFANMPNSGGVDPIANVEFSPGAASPFAWETFNTDDAIKSSAVGPNSIDMIMAQFDPYYMPFQSHPNDSWPQYSA